MAAVDVSRVVALTNKAVTLKSKAHWARAAEKFAEAVAAAQALHQPDCLIAAHLQASRAEALAGHAKTAGVPEARQVELMHSALLELLPAAMASLERRLAAGTLLPGACRSYEVAWCAGMMAHADALAANLPNAAVHVPSAAELSASSTYVGYEAYSITAAVALRLCAFATDQNYWAQKLNLPEATVVACSVFVESAFDMIRLNTGVARMLETCLVQNAQSVIDEQQLFRATCEWHARILTAWRRLQSSGVLQRRRILECVSAVTAYNTHAAATAAAAAVARGLRFCALHTCDAQEVHASHFKRCSACLTVVYCCKEHQVQGWPAHKAACRAARKAPEEQADNEASGA
jgi:hypothetical protein